MNYFNCIIHAFVVYGNPKLTVMQHFGQLSTKPLLYIEIKFLIIKMSRTVSLWCIISIKNKQKAFQNREKHCYDFANTYLNVLSVSHSDIVALQADKSYFQLKSTPTSHAVCVRGPAYPSTLSLSLVISLGVFGQQIHKSIMVLSFMPWFTQLISPGLQRSLKRVSRR